MSKPDTSNESTNYRLKDTDKPYQDPEVLHRLYWHEEMTQTEISEHLDCGQGTVGEWMRRLHIPRRTMKESYDLITPDHIPLSNDQFGYVCWRCHEGVVFVHRLLAVAEFGFEAVRDRHIHHGAEDDGPNELPSYECRWANWPGNLELVRNADHQRKHLKVKGEKRREIADRYERQDVSSRKLATQYDVSSGTVLRIHKEYYGDNDGE